jgi:hypothetical protein
MTWYLSHGMNKGDKIQTGVEEEAETLKFT